MKGACISAKVFIVIIRNAIHCHVATALAICQLRLSTGHTSRFTFETSVVIYFFIKAGLAVLNTNRIFKEYFSTVISKIARSTFLCSIYASLTV